MADKLTGLQKVAALLKQMGISEEASKEFTSVCESWYNEEKDKLQQEYRVRLEKAKKLCVEEVEAHKANLSRGVKMFLEGQGDVIRKASEKRAAIAESEAVDKLKQITSLLGGIDVNGAANAQAMQAESKKNAELVNQVAGLSEAISREKAKSAKLGELSEKSLNRQRELEKTVTEHTRLLGEARDQLRTKGKGQTQTLSENKVKAAKPVSKKSVVSESDVGSGKKPITKSGDTIDMIASQMD